MIPRQTWPALFSRPVFSASGRCFGKGPSGSAISTATGSTQIALPSCIFQKDDRTTRRRANAHFEEYLSLPPIKGLSAQPLLSVELLAKKPVPHDRVFALVRPGAPFDTSQPQMGKEGIVRDADA